MGKGIFVTGTGTDVGKTYVTGLIIKKIKENGMTPGYFKAAMSGNEREEDGTLIPGDALWVKNVSGISQSVEEMCPYVYEHAYSPHLASRLEGNHVEMAVVLDNYRKVKEKYDYITVEGSGGILCPICFDEARIGLTDIIDEMELLDIKNIYFEKGSYTEYILKKAKEAKLNIVNFVDLYEELKLK